MRAQHVLIFDDLPKQADAYRAVLPAAPPHLAGARGLPGSDAFYLALASLSSRRCAKPLDELGAGSMTGLPIVETKANDVSRVHPDRQRHLHHRRSVLPGVRPLQRRSARAR
ncbi:hypothetical protein [Streptomyces sp. KL116D]|uniref:hypothetical protein n=1 Tax=Streptomyces sp. KL116D TaxID=3045152 RepID=UPI003555DB44